MLGPGFGPLHSQFFLKNVDFIAFGANSVVFLNCTFFRILAHYE